MNKYRKGSYGGNDKGQKKNGKTKNFHSLFKFSFCLNSTNASSITESIDQHEQCIINFKLAGAYKFFAEPGDFEDRFVLHLFSEDIPVQQESLTFETPIIYVSENRVFVSVIQPLNGRVSIIDLWGREIVSTYFSDSELLEINMTGKHGFYIVRVITSAGLFARKIYIPN